jgi:hypothetical protein
MVTSLAWEPTPDGPIGTMTTGGHRVGEKETTLVRSYIYHAHAKSRFFGTKSPHLLEYGTSCQVRLPMCSAAFYRASLGGLPLNSVYIHSMHNRPWVPRAYYSHLLGVDSSWVKTMPVEFSYNRANRVLATLFTVQLHIFQDPSMSLSWATHTQFWKFLFGSQFPVIPVYGLGACLSDVSSVVNSYLDREREWANNFSSRLDLLCRDVPMPSERENLSIIETIMYLEFLMDTKVSYHEDRSDFVQSLGLESVKSVTVQFNDRVFKRRRVDYKPRHNNRETSFHSTRDNHSLFRDNRQAHAASERLSREKESPVRALSIQKREREASSSPGLNSKSQRFVSRSRSRSRSRSQTNESDSGMENGEV